MNLEEKILNEEVIYHGNYLNIAKCEVKLPDGNVVKRDIIHHPGAVAILAVKDGKILLVEQFRYAVNRTLLEIPAGKRNKGEDSRECAIRELEEETGYKAEKLEFLTEILPAPGFCDEVLHLYRAEDLVKGETNPDFDEFINVKEIPVEEFKAMALRGEVMDAKTIAALLYI